MRKSTGQVGATYGNSTPEQNATYGWQKPRAFFSMAHQEKLSGFRSKNGIASTHQRGLTCRNTRDSRSGFVMAKAITLWALRMVSSLLSTTLQWCRITGTRLLSGSTQSLENEWQQETRRAIAKVEARRDEAVRGLAAYYNTRIAQLQEAWVLLEEDKDG